ncbi:hypothetical protein N7462_000049 [Penicillium macrosclerotiorum]|uniref:uncharacterized protein n=1 Tax=Penicillium macrosclerotiorum TaxID=303699 RepID=UPI002548806E|nr:uncharacterized protein N7462_000049 [Penicillium macrosclerotiorum]KAJ5698044.1 hypothetical protein N7462_000049 [Penicillium macrosclerotiorum]
MTIKSLLKSLLATTNQLKAKYLPRSNGDEFEQWMKEFEDKDRAEAQSKWIHQHRHEIRRGSQIVQREMHISAQLTYYQNLAEELNKLEPVDFELLAHCDTELKKMNQEHWKHRECLARLEGAKPPGRLVQEYCKNQQKHQHQKAQTLWKAERVYSAVDVTEANRLSQASTQAVEACQDPIRSFRGIKGGYI